MTDLSDELAIRQHRLLSEPARCHPTPPQNATFHEMRFQGAHSGNARPMPSSR